MPPIEKRDRKAEEMRDQLLHQVQLEKPDEPLHRKLAGVRTQSTGHEHRQQQADQRPQCGRRPQLEGQARRETGRLCQDARQEVANQKDRQNRGRNPAR